MYFHTNELNGQRDDDQLPPGLVRLARYTIENYFADPIALYCAVVSTESLDEKLSWSAACGVPRGDLGSLRTCAPATLQRISDHVIAAVEAKAPGLDRTVVEVTFHRDAGPVTLARPRWLFDLSKDDIKARVAAIQKTAGPGVLQSDHFNSGPEVSGLVPDDLVEVYRSLATSEI